MTAAPSTRWIYSDKRHPCPVCGRTKDRDCRISGKGDQVICHHPRDMRPGEVVNGWAFTGNISDGRAANFVPDKPREASSRPDLRVLHGRKPAPVSTPITWPVRLARLPEPWPEPPAARRPHGFLEWFSATQWVEVERTGPSVKAAHKPRHKRPDGEVVKNAGTEPWPLYGEAEALAADGWVLELEGPKCADWARAGGAVAISQPGHARGPAKVRPRYARLRAAGVPGVVYISDHDDEGRRYAKDFAEAAAWEGLPFLHLPASKVWAGIAAKGSIDDAPGTPAEQIAAIEAAIAEALVAAPPPAEEPLREAVPADPLDLDALLGPGEEGKLRRPRKDKLTHALALVLPLRFNLLSNRIERNGEPIDGDFLSTLYLDLAETHGLDIAKDRAIDAAIRVARQNAYHPVRDYLENLPVCLSPEDWAALDLRCFGRDDSSGWGLLHLQRQLVGLVARAMRPGCELHTCLVLQSDQQGIGKSSLWKILGGEWFSDSLGDLRDVREDRLQLHSAWIHEWGEIDNVMGKRESETLKRFLSCSRDDVRRPYGRGTEQLLRSCGIVGTTNRRDFIKDPTGNRRFPIIPITRVELGWIADHRDAIWGSAMATYRAGERWHYEAEENAHLTVAAASFAAEDPLRDQLETWLEDHPNLEELPVAHALWGMGYGDRMRDREICRQVSTAFRSIGWSQTTSRRRYLLPNGERTDKATGWIRPT